MRTTKKKGDPAGVAGTYLSEEDEEFGKHLITFSIPDDPSLVEILLTKDIVRVDHRSLRTLGADSRERAEVRDLLYNVVVFLENRQCDAARALLDHTEGVYYQHIQAKNRLRYLGGMGIGIAAVVALGALTFAFVQFPDRSSERSLLPLLLLFAGMGTITSVLTRLSQIDLRDQTSPSIVYVSGMGRPVTGAFLSIVIYYILALRIVDIHVGITSGAPPQGVFLIAAFLCGFSERFAQDVLSKFAGETAPLEDIHPTSTATKGRRIQG